MTQSHHRKSLEPEQAGKTLENQDTIWHLWSLNDFLLGVGLRPTGISQKTGRENYIRENVYAAHSAPSLFAPQMSDYSSTLNLWKRVGGVMERGRFFPSLAFGRGGCWHSLASLSQCELPIWQCWRYVESTLQNVEPPLLSTAELVTLGKVGNWGKCPHKRTHTLAYPLSVFSPVMLNLSVLMFFTIIAKTILNLALILGR